MSSVASSRPFVPLPDGAPTVLREMARAAEIVALRALGLSLAQVAGVLKGDAQSLEPALSAHQSMLEGRARQLADTVEKVRRLRADLSKGQTPAAGELQRLLNPASKFQRHVQPSLALGSANCSSCAISGH